MRWFLRAAAVAAAAAVLATPATGYALRMAYSPPAQRVATAEAVVVGKVTGFEKDVVEVPSPYAGAKEKQKYKVAIVTVETGLVGADKLKEVKVGVFQPPKPDPKAKGPAGPGGPAVRPIRGPAAAVELKEGQELVLFLAKHPAADFYLMPGTSPPVDLKDEAGKKTLEAVKAIAEVLADPMKSLKSDKAETRAEAAAALVMKYRAFPPFGGEVEQKPIGAEESTLILNALAEGDWSTQGPGRAGITQRLTPLQAFYALGLNNMDGWAPPIIAPGGGQPVDFGAVHKDAFKTWLAGPGKNYQIKKVVAKK